MKFRRLFTAALLLSAAPLFAQAPAASLQSGATSGREKAKPAENASAATDVDPAVIDSLRKAFAAQRAKGTYRALLDSSLGGYVMPSLELEAVYPDRIRIKRSGMEIIFVGGKGLVRKVDKWSPAPASLAKSLGAIDDPQEDEKMLNKSTYAKSLGQTKVDERILAGYEVHTKLKSGLTKSKYFISLDDSLIRRVETRGEIQGNALITTMTVGDYGVPIEIELPK